LLSSNLKVSRTQGAFLSYEKNMNTMTKENILCTSQQGYEIKFACQINVMCHAMNAFEMGSIFIL
jgi:hypothetical protein